jgi:hypothetical protein
MNYLHGLLGSLLTVGALILMLLAVGYVPPAWTPTVRLANGFVIVGLLGWIIWRILHYEQRLEQHRAAIMELLESGERNRSETLERLQERTEAIAKDLADKAVQSAEAVSRVADERHVEMTKKLDEVLAKENGGHH